MDSMEVAYCQTKLRIGFQAVAAVHIYYESRSCYDIVGAIRMKCDGQYLQLSMGFSGWLVLESSPQAHINRRAS